MSICLLIILNLLQCRERERESGADLFIFFIFHFFYFFNNKKYLQCSGREGGRQNELLSASSQCSEQEHFPNLCANYQSGIVSGLMVPRCSYISIQSHAFVLLSN